MLTKSPLFWSSTINKGRKIINIYLLQLPTSFLEEAQSGGRQGLAITAVTIFSG